MKEPTFRLEMEERMEFARIRYANLCAPPEAWQMWIWGTIPVLAA
jgi:hypothetical protein